MDNKIGKTVNLELVGVDGNAHAIMGAFRRQAQRQGDWNPEEIQSVIDEAMEGDYDHLLATIMTYCEPQDDDSNSENEDY